MPRCCILSAFVVLVIVAQVNAWGQGAEQGVLEPGQDTVAFLKEQFAAKVVPQAMRAELKNAIRAHLTEDGPAPLGGILFRNDSGLAMTLIRERSSEEEREHAKVLAGLSKLKAGRATDTKLLIAYGEKMIELVKASYDSPPSSSPLAESNQKSRDGEIGRIGSAVRMLGMASRVPGANVASLAGIYEASVLGTKHPTYAILPSRCLTFRRDRCGLLLVKFEVFEPSEQGLNDLRKAAAGVPLVILDITGIHGRVRVDDEGLVELCRGRLQDLFPAND